MVVKTKTVTGRRTLHFNSLDDVVADAQRLVASPTTRTLGNWPLGQLFSHLATAVNGSIDGIPHKAPWFIRAIAPVFKRRFLTKPMSAGFNLPKEAEVGFYPAATSQEGFEQLRAAVGRWRTEKMTSKHPVLGKLTHEEWSQLHLRHAELHLSFAVPG
jgi:hypothetical protein